MKIRDLAISNKIKSKHVFNKSLLGFTVVELIVVIVVIGILTAITVVGYLGVTKKTTAAALQSDLSSASDQLESYQISNKVYPTTIDCSGSNATLSTNLCLNVSSDETLTYEVNNSSNPVSFVLDATRGDLTYRITSNTQRAYLVIVCPTNFITVPGSTTYGTSDFCVMKYEAKIAGQSDGYQTYSESLVPSSRADGTPWTNLTQAKAKVEAITMPGCTGCHLITEAEWMTLLQNILSVPSNWSDGILGSGFVYQGHINNNPSGGLAADTNDSNGIYGETLTGTTVNTNTKRTLTLTNGEVIWDFAGNVNEWTDGQLTSGQPGVTGETEYNWKEWNVATNINSLVVNATLSGTGISGANNWTSSNGLGRLYSYINETSTTKAFARGGGWTYGRDGGVASLSLINSSTLSYGSIFGFRVTSSGQ